MQGRSPEPCRRCDCPAQTGWPYRRARWKALRHAVGVTHLQDHELAGKVPGQAFEGLPKPPQSTQLRHWPRGFGASATVEAHDANPSAKLGRPTPFRDAPASLRFLFKKGES